MIQYALYIRVSGALLADYSGRVRGLTFASNNRGFAECKGFIPMGLTEAFSLYSAIGGLRVQIADTSSGAVYDGRIEDVAISGDGVTLTAMGYARSLSDAPYTALWSSTRVSEWRTYLSSDDVGFSEGRYEFDTNNRLSISPRKGETLGSTGSVKEGGLAFDRASLSSRQIIGVSFDFQTSAPLNWVTRLIAYTTNPYAFSAVVWSLASSGGLRNGAVHVVITACDRLVFGMFYNVADAVFAGETGSAYLQITNLRVVTATANRVNTTITANVASSIGMTVAVVSTARMYPGLRLVFTQSATANRGCTVVSVTDATHFVTDMDPSVGTWLIGNTVQGFVIYADEIADDLITVTSALNSGQLSSSLSLTDSPALDLLNESYADMLPCDIMDYLIRLGDASGNQWEWGVKDAQRLYMRAQNAQRTWYIDVSDLDIQRTLDQLTNSVYAVYSDANNRAVRSAATADSGSIARYGLTRRKALAVQTTSAAQAAYQQATALADGREPRPRAGVVVRQVFDAGGSRWPLWYVQAGDTMVIRNLSPSLGVAIDRVRVFRLTRAEYRFDDDTLTLEPETPIARLDVLLAQLAAGVARPARG